MGFSAVHEERSAVLFIVEGSVRRQMLFSEFEAILDQVVPLAEFAGREASMVYVDVNGALHITAAAFFLLRFSASGHADQNWNIPLRHLLSQAGAGPDLGAGPIRLVCRSRCPVAWHQAELWDPVLGGDQDSFGVLSRTIAENRLGLRSWDFEDDGDVLAGSGDIPVLGREGAEDARERDRAASSLRALRLRLSLQRSEQEELLARLHCKHREEMQALVKACAGLEEKLAQERRVNQHLKQSLDQQGEDFRKMRALISSQIAKIESGEQLGKQLGEEFDLRLSVATAELQEQLERKDLERASQDEEIARLGTVVEDLEQQKRRLQAKAAGGDFLNQMREAGISYVAQQPGAGEFKVPHEDIAAYLDSPQEYAARYCYVNLELYRAWLEHHKQPRCSKALDGGRHCGLPVHRVDAPATFEPGESDRCSQHRESSLTISRLLNRAG